MTARTTLALTLLALATAMPARAAVPDRVVLYRVKPSAGRPGFEPIAPVQLEDDIGSHGYAVTKPRQLGVSAAATMVAPAGAGTGFVEYAIAATRDAAPVGRRAHVPVVDQCGDVTVTLRQPSSLLVPATVDPHGAAVPPDADTNELDHFLCYKAALDSRLPDGTTVGKLARGTQMDVADAFGTRRYDLLGISKVCRPVDKDVDPANPPVVLSGPGAGRTKSIAPASIRDPERSLVCYRAKLATTYVAQNGCGPADPRDRGTPTAAAPVGRATEVSTADQLGALWLDTVKPTEICVPTGPRDTDHDGVPDPIDPCPSTTPGAAQVIPGCSALDLFQHADDLLVPLRKNAQAMIDHIDDDPEIADAVQEIRDALPDFDAAASDTRAGDACAGRLRAGAGQDHFANALRVVGEAQAIADSEARMSRPDMLEGDTTPEGSRAMTLGALLAWANGLVADGQRVGDAIDALCDGSVPIQTRGLVRAVHDAERRIELDDGRVFGLADPMQLDSALTPGQTIDITGLGLGPQEGLGNQVTPGDGFPIPKVEYTECLQLRIAPIQRFAPVSNGPYTLDRPDAYDAGGGVLLLEEGMRLGAEDVCPKNPSPLLTFPRYSLRIDSMPKAGGAYATLAAALAAGDAPVALGKNNVGILVVQHQAQTCQFVGLQIKCTWPPTVTSTEQFEYVTVPDTSLCSVDYSSILADVNDQTPGDFRSVFVEKVTTVDMNDPNTAPVFEAEGYPVDQGVSSYPTILPVVGNQPFAIRNYDFMEVRYQPVPGVNDITPLLVKMTQGIDHPAGLAWPHVRGTHNGHTWQYSCQLDKMTRDVVDFCAGGTQAFFRLPWAPGVDGWKQGQGNLPNCPDSKMNPQGVCAKSATDFCTHGGGYAYDMVAPCMSDIRAARGGRVISVDMSQNQNSWPKCAVTNDPCGTTTTCDPSAYGNVLWVEHQDGSVVRYVHPNQNKILKNVGDYVKRGELVGYVGMTGFTSGPHLHLGPYLKINGKSSLALFEAIDPDQNNKLLKCYEPKPDGPSGTCYGITQKALRSNNKKQ